MTETILLDEFSGAKQLIDRLRAYGYRVSIDDFGSGYSSLGQLQRLRADVLKLDRSFVCAGLQGPREQIVIENLVNMASELGMEVVCEGVETQVQVKVLQDIGCHIAQGYYYYRPMQTAAFEQLLG